MVEVLSYANVTAEDLSGASDEIDDDDIGDWLEALLWDKDPDEIEFHSSKIAETLTSKTTKNIELIYQAIQEKKEKKNAATNNTICQPSGQKE